MKNGKGGYWNCRTLQSANEGYVAWQNSVIATHKWGIRQDVANGKQSHLTWLLGSSCSISEQQAGSQQTGGGVGGWGGVFARHRVLMWSDYNRQSIYSVLWGANKQMLSNFSQQ